MIFRRALPIALIALFVAAGSATAGGGAHASASCKPPKYPGNGYFTSLRVAGTSCTSGRRVTLAHYRCRTKHGIRGRCSAVLGYRCSETRQSIKTEFDARVTCKSGRKKVVYTYQQNT